VGPCAKIPKVPIDPSYGLSVCSANNAPYSGSLWVSLSGLKFVMQAKVKYFR